MHVRCGCAEDGGERLRERERYYSIYIIHGAIVSREMARTELRGSNASTRSSQRRKRRKQTWQKRVMKKFYYFWSFGGTPCRAQRCPGMDMTDEDARAMYEEHMRSVTAGIEPREDGSEPYQGADDGVAGSKPKAASKPNRKKPRAAAGGRVPQHALANRPAPSLHQLAAGQGQGGHWREVAAGQGQGGHWREAAPLHLVPTSIQDMKLPALKRWLRVRDVPPAEILEAGTKAELHALAMRYNILEAPDEWTIENLQQRKEAQRKSTTHRRSPRSAKSPKRSPKKRPPKFSTLADARAVAAIRGGMPSPAEEASSGGRLDSDGRFPSAVARPEGALHGQLGSSSTAGPSSAHRGSSSAQAVPLELSLSPAWSPQPAALGASQVGGGLGVARGYLPFSPSCHTPSSTHTPSSLALSARPELASAFGSHLGVSRPNPPNPQSLQDPRHDTSAGPRSSGPAMQSAPPSAVARASLPPAQAAAASSIGASGVSLGGSSSIPYRGISRSGPTSTSAATTGDPSTSAAGRATANRGTGVAAAPQSKYPPRGSTGGGRAAVPAAGSGKLLGVASEGRVGPDEAHADSLAYVEHERSAVREGARRAAGKKARRPTERDELAEAMDEYGLSLDDLSMISGAGDRGGPTQESDDSSAAPAAPTRTAERQEVAATMADMGLSLDELTAAVAATKGQP